MPTKPAFDPHVHIQPAGVWVDLNPEWPLYQDVVPSQGRVYQPIGDTGGTVFVRYGADATVDACLAGLGGGLPQPPTLLEDQRLQVRGLPARRVRLIQERGSAEMYTSGKTGPEHRTLPAGRDVIVAVGMEVRGVSVLAGYIVPEQAVERFRAVLDAIVASVRPD
jgi:hypothetical protein